MRLQNRKQARLPKVFSDFKGFAGNSVEKTLIPDKEW